MGAKIAVLTATLVGFLSTEPAAAEGQRVLAAAKPYTATQLVKILRQAGFVEIEAESAEQIHFKRSGQIFYLNRYDDGDLVLYFGITGYERLNAQDLNEWNRQKRFTRAYLDRDGDAVLESDMLFDGGLSARKIAAWVNVFVGLVDGYEEFLSERNAARQSVDPVSEKGRASSL